jgi:hypothetical protein
MKKITVALLVVLAIASIGASLTLTGSSMKTSYVAGTYANSQVDTLTWIRSGNETGATFWMRSRDSVSITIAILRRQFRGGLAPVKAGDTLLTAKASIGDTTLNATITLSPYCDTTKIFVTYAGSANGVTTPTVEYGIGKNF